MKRRTWRYVVAAAAAAVGASALMAAHPAGAAGDPVISTDKMTLASSVQTGNPTNAVVDGDPATRWASDATDSQWIQIDLGYTSAISKVVLKWETAYGKSFQLQASTNMTTWTTLWSTTAGTGGTQTIPVTGSGRYVRMLGTQRGTGYGYSLYTFDVYGQSGMPATGWVNTPNPVTGVTPSQANPPHAYFHEFQANCAVSRSTLPDDPIVFYNQPGASHQHTFMGNTSTTAGTTTASLQANGTACIVPGDKSAYWMPTMYNGSAEVLPVGRQVIYYKTNLIDYTSVRPFPTGLRYVVGSPTDTAAQFAAQSYEGWECGESYHNADFPASCPAGTQINVRYQAPSCWDGVHLDSPDHKSHMAYPVNGRCTAAHPVALPMIEFKMAFPVSGSLANVRLSSGRGYSFHYDFYNAWDAPTLAAMVTHCIVGGLQCDARGYDEAHPEKGAALNQNYQLP